MKSALKFFITLTICILTFWSCSDNEAPISRLEDEGKVSFSFDVVNSISNKKTFRGNQVTKGNRTDAKPSKIVVSIKSLEDGSLVYDKETLNIIAFNNNYISDPITLKTGNYELTEYFVLDENGNTVYLTPLEGSSLSYLVNDPLASEFSIAKDDSKQITPEVISPEGFEADDFGYTDFSFDIVESIDFLISAHIFDIASESYELTNANVQILGDGTDEVYNETITNITKQIRVRDRYESYTITITKSEYDDHIVTLTNAELKTFTNASLVIKLSPVTQKYDVEAKENSVSGGEGLLVGVFEAGKTLVITTDSNQFWSLDVSVSDFRSNSEGAILIDPNHKYNNGNQEFLIGTLVGSFDNGISFFKIGTRYEGVVSPTSELKLYCWDSDFENNGGAIEVSIQVFE